MKKILHFSLPIFCLILLSSFALHKFYVGIYQMNYMPKKKELQVTARLFIDDFEKALERKYKKKMYLATPKEIAGADAMIQTYMEEKFQVKVNGTERALKLLGKETEDNVYILYLKAPIAEKISSVEIHNSVLTELYPDQQNIVHTNINGNKKSLLLTDSEPEGDITF